MKSNRLFWIGILGMAAWFAVGAPLMSGCAKKQPATTYVCPMHPDVTSDKPGKCPKCGMDLVPKK